MVPFFQDDEIFQIRATPIKKCYKGKAEQITRKLEARFSINVETARPSKLKLIYLELAIKSYLTEHFVSFSTITSAQVGLLVHLVRKLPLDFLQPMKTKSNCNITINNRLKITQYSKCNCYIAKTFNSPTASLQSGYFEVTRHRKI